ncbi:MAG: plasmid stabilization protein [Candidatus Solibacter sp.]
MGSILIRQLDDGTKTQLRLRAARRGHSMEQEAREILEQVLASERSAGVHLVDAIRRRVDPLGGIDLPVVQREPVREPLKLGQ